jgi:hypothetical protein
MELKLEHMMLELLMMMEMMMTLPLLASVFRELVSRRMPEEQADFGE